METKIVPTVFALNKKDFDLKLKKLDFCSELHLDFMDATFTNKNSVSIEHMSLIKKYPNIDFGIHLMVDYPELYLKKILKYDNIKLVLFHIEPFENNIDELFRTINLYKNKGFAVGLVLNPKTDVKEISLLLKEIKCVMFMSVWPGAEGQEFISEVLTQIKILRDKSKDIYILIDGGINDKTILDAKNSGVNIFCVGSYVSSNPNPKENFEKLNEIISENKILIENK